MILSETPWAPLKYLCQKSPGHQLHISYDTDIIEAFVTYNIFILVPSIVYFL